MCDSPHGMVAKPKNFRDTYYNTIILYIYSGFSLYGNIHFGNAMDVQCMALSIQDLLDNDINGATTCVFWEFDM